MAELGVIYLRFGWQSPLFIQHILSCPTEQLVVSEACPRPSVPWARPAGLACELLRAGEQGAENLSKPQGKWAQGSKQHSRLAEGPFRRSLLMKETLVLVFSKMMWPEDFFKSHLPLSGHSIHLPTHPATRCPPTICLLIHSSIYLSIHPSIYPLVQLPIHSLIYPHT